MEVRQGNARVSLPISGSSINDDSFHRDFVTEAGKIEFTPAYNDTFNITDAHAIK